MLARVAKQALQAVENISALDAHRKARRHRNRRKRGELDQPPLQGDRRERSANRRSPSRARVPRENQLVRRKQRRAAPDLTTLIAESEPETRAPLNKGKSTELCCVRILRRKESNGNRRDIACSSCDALLSLHK